MKTTNLLFRIVLIILLAPIMSSYAQNDIVLNIKSINHDIFQDFKTHSSFTDKANKWIKWCNDTTVYTFGFTCIACDAIVVARFTPEDLKTFGIMTNAEVTKIRFVPGNCQNPYTIQIYQGGTSPTDPGALMYQQTVTEPLIYNVYNEIELTTPFPIDVSKELWIGYQVISGGMIVGCDTGPNVMNKGDLMCANGIWTTAFSVSDGGYNFNWNIDAFIISSGCTPVNNLLSEKINNNSVSLSWSEPEEDLEIEGYHIFRNEQLLNEQLTIDTSFFDEDLSIGEYEYYIITYYTNGCVSDSSNHVAETIELGVKELKELEGVRVFPNPTTGELRITNYELRIKDVEVFDVYGRKQKAERRKGEKENGKVVMDISELHSGIYFVKITTEKGAVTKKIVKY